MDKPSNIGQDRLLSMLKGAKSVMNKVESGDFTKGHVDESKLYNNNTNLVASIPNNGNANGYTPTPISYNNQKPQAFKNLHTTKMPESIVKAMVEKPIQEISGAGPTFTLDDVPTLINNPNNQQQESYKPNNNYNNNEKMIMISESELNAKINEALLKFMATTFTRTLTENTIKKTIGTLIKEGKIKVTKKQKL